LNFSTGVFSGGHAEGDTITDVENIEASNFNDIVIGGSDDDIIFGLDGDDTLSGGGGDDVFIGGAGADTIDGGTGFDLVTFEESLSGVIANLETGIGSGGEAEGDTYTNIFDFIGSDFSDRLTGDSSQNFFFGRDGNDVLSGGENDDLMTMTP